MSASDEHAARALKGPAATLSERAASLEQHQLPQQQQKIQSEDKDKDEETYALASQAHARRGKIDFAELIDEPARATRCTFPADESL